MERGKSTKPVPKDEHVDFGIITVIDEEFTAVQKILGLETKAERVQGISYYHGYLTSSITNNNHHLVCAKCPYRSNVPAGDLAKSLVSVWQPTYLLVIGIAGGVEGRENIRLGDVVVHENLEYYGFKKVMNKEIRERKYPLEPPSLLLLNIMDDIKQYKDAKWFEIITSKRPSGSKENPAIIRGEILSGDELLNDPDSKDLIDLLDKHDKAIAVEMESGGVGYALYSARLMCIKTDFLVIRGISDYCNKESGQEDRDVWTSYAAEAAAALARALIQNTEKDIDFSIQDKYKTDFRNGLKNYELAFGQPKIDFSLSFKSIDDNTQPELPILSLIDEVKSKRKVILRGPAGGGKSKVLGELARLLLVDRQTIPILLNLREKHKMRDVKLSELGETTDNWKKKLDVLFKTSINDISYARLESFPPQRTKFIMVDGLNEVAAGDFSEEDTRQILDTLWECVRNDADYQTCVLVTDRMAQRSYHRYDWAVYRLNTIDQITLESQIKNNFGEKVLDELSTSDRKLLEIPYFLDYAIASKSLHLGSAAAAIESFFKKQMKLSDDDLNKIAKAAFEIYVDKKSPSFPIRFLIERTGKQIVDLLTQAAILQPAIDDQTQFDHQLKHDYLASRHMIQHEDLWDLQAFDAVTFQSNSYEPLFMAIEQIDNDTKGDKFLTKVYDWNWFAAVRCVLEATRTENKCFSIEMRNALLAIVATKLFDSVSPTKKRTIYLLEKFPPEISGKLVTIKKIDELVQMVKEMKSDKEWFIRWKNLFILELGYTLKEDDIRDIISENAIIGWTASNVLKKLDLADCDLRQLRAYYDTFIDATPRAMTIRWRVVHTLGACDNDENVNLLLRALDSDQYLWVRYGSARSLVEIAAKTSTRSLAEKIVNEIKKRTDKLPRKVKEEIGMAAQYTDAQPFWFEVAYPLLDFIRNHQRLEIDRTKWHKIIDDFQGFYKKENKK